MRRPILLLAALFLALAHAPAARAQQADSVYARPGDVIHLAVYRQADFTGDWAVGADGTIMHPLLSDVVVVGVPRSVIRERLRTALARFERDPQFVFEIRYRVAVGGEVRDPNLLSLPPQTTVAQAIAAAGGANEFGALDRVVLLRDGERRVINLQRPDQDLAALTVRSGDQIRVPRRVNAIRDYLGPFASVVGALAAVIAVVRIK